MLAFVRAVECHGFTPAAHDLGVTPSAVSKLVTRLERKLGVRLLQRSTRRLALTAEGEIYFERVQRIVGEIADLESDVMRFAQQPRGRVRISVGTAFATYALVPALPEFVARYPEITLDLVISEYAIDLVEAGIDLAIRVGPLGDVNLAARRIGELERVITAAPAYLAKHGVPRKAARAHGERDGHVTFARVHEQEGRGDPLVLRIVVDPPSGPRRPGSASPAYTSSGS
jgi:DNA-binding transcriptional LysR family regulator